MPDPVVPIDAAPAAIPPPIPVVTMRDPATGRAYGIPAEQVATYADQGFVPETQAEQGARLGSEARAQAYGGAANTVRAALAGAGRGVSLGATDALARAFGGEQAAADLTGLREEHGLVSGGSEIAGALLPAILSGGASTPAGLAARAGKSITALGEGGGALAKLGAAAAGGAVEGGLYGAGQGITQVSLSDDPVTLGGAMSAISSNAMFGAGIGGGIGGATRGVEIGLSRAKKALDGALLKQSEARAMKAVGELETQAASEAADVGAQDLTTLDTRGLGRAEAAEIERVGAERQPMRDRFVEALKEAHVAREVDKDWLSALSDRARNPDQYAREQAAVALRTDQKIRNLLDNTAGLAEHPERALNLLQTEQQALEGLQQNGRGALDAFRNAAENADEVVGKDLAESVRKDLLAGKIKGYKVGKGAIQDPAVIDDIVAREVELRLPSEIRKRFPREGAEAIPEYGRLRKELKAAGADSVERTIPARALDDHGYFEPPREVPLPGGGYGPAPVDVERLASARRAIAEGQREAITLGISPKGKVVLVDGRHRLQAAIEADAPIKVKWSTSAEPAASDTLRGGGRQSGPLILPKELQGFADNRLGIALGKNQDLQNRIAALKLAPKSERLSQIEAAREALKNKTSAPVEAAQPSAGGAALNALASFAGPIGAVATSGMRAFGGLKKAAGAVSEKMAQSASRFLTVAAKGADKSVTLAPIVATKILGQVRFGESKKEQPTDLPGLFKARTDEIREQVHVTPDGATQMRPQARAKLAAKFDGIRAIDPRAADHFEEEGARRIEWLASQIPRRPDMMVTHFGPDTWKPSDMEMRSFARKVAAAEDPTGVFERALHGAVTPEEVETLRAVHPELLASYTQQVTQQLPTLQARLPYARRLALSILTGVPVDPAMTPEVMAVLQGQFAADGGAPATSAPLPAPAFGSIKKSTPQPTPADRHAQGG